MDLAVDGVVIENRYLPFTHDHREVRGIGLVLQTHDRSEDLGISRLRLAAKLFSRRSCHLNMAWTN